jgi:hypothetical protein
MKDQIEKLKAELAEFIELSNAATKGPWKEVLETVWSGKAITVCDFAEDYDAAFIARSRNISPPLVECLLSQIEWLENVAIPIELEQAHHQLQQILTIWEAAK